MTPIILASSSERRRAILASHGIRFCVIEPDADGPMPPGVSVDLAVRVTAHKKAESVVSKCAADSYIVAADTVVVCDGVCFGKPATPERATEMLTNLRGGSHLVLTAVCVRAAATGKEELDVSRSKVTMRDFDDDELHTYVASGDPLDKAGAYAVNGGGRDLVHEVKGRVDTVIGLDFSLMMRLLKSVGYPDPLPEGNDAPLPPVSRAHRRQLAAAASAPRA